MTISTRGYLYGVDHVPEIRGFEVLARPDHFTLARQGRKLFGIEQARGGHRLTPILERRGELMPCSDRCIFIPQD